ncbi:hypothetical protein POVWA2_047100 [Plasmodium ovale wallikeri]|uniref:Uncharacterized protein n=1 Tax=Plasmodium ovale wallikeri TaxID=864142 RepID=A0A1A8ZJJ9_PLAOA|nr:hypothetical protein POVWA2_047100 [Plasmodium ovale wallikeri]
MRCPFGSFLWGVIRQLSLGTDSDGEYVHFFEGLKWQEHAQKEGTQVQTHTRTHTGVEEDPANGGKRKSDLHKNGFHKSRILKNGKWSHIGFFAKVLADSGQNGCVRSCIFFFFFFFFMDHKNCKWITTRWKLMQIECLEKGRKSVCKCTCTLLTDASMDIKKKKKKKKRRQ